MSQQSLAEIVRALLLAADTPLSLSRLLDILREGMNLDRAQVREALDALREHMEGSSIELAEVASGYRIQVRHTYTDWVRKLWQEKPQKYSRALLETLALVVYRQPLTRGDIEEIRGVSTSGTILKTLIERGWVQEVGHREAPGRPALLASTRQFLDDFNLLSLDQLPALPDLDDPERLEAALQALELPGLAPETATDTDADAETESAADTDPMESEASDAHPPADDLMDSPAEDDRHVR